MKKIWLLLICCVSVAISFAQKETFDLISYTVPKGWTKEVTENTTSYTQVKNSTWCRINIVKSTISKGDINQDFKNEWKELVVENYKPTGEAQLNEVQQVTGWKIKSGGSKFSFNNSDALVFLTTATGYNRCVSIVATTSSQEFIKDIDALLASVDLVKPATVSTQTTQGNTDKNALLGTWCISASDNSNYRVKNGIMSTISRQYTFKENGNYTCNIKTFDPVMSSILLGRESGTYQINGNNLTINPQRSVLEEWSKKNNADQWGSLLKTQKIEFEKLTYSFTKINIPEINEWQLILKAANQTRRDGPFNNNERNAWIYILSSPARPIIKLPGE